MSLRSRGAVRATRRGVLLSVVVVALALSPATAQAGPGDLTQKAGQAGCVRQTPLFGGPGEPDPLCAFGNALADTTDVAISPDGKNVYATTQQFGGVAIFDRNPTTGALTQKQGLAGCITEDGGGADLFGPPVCQDGKALQNATSVTVSPDGTNVYVGSSFGVAILDRNTTTGELTQKPDPAGCISQTGQSNRDDPATSGECLIAPAVTFPTSLTISPDGKTAYVASHAPSFSGVSDQGALAVLDRDTTTGALTQKAGTAGCVSHTGRSNPDDPATAGACQVGTAINGVFSVTVSPDGNNVYAVSEPADAVAIFDRDATGVLTQKAGTAGCVSEDGTGGACADGTALDLTNETFKDEFAPAPPRAVAVSPDGKSVYVAAHGSDAVAVFDRDAAGALTQKSGTAGCVSEDGTAGACADGNALDRASGVAVSPDGQSVYAVSYEHTSNTLEAVAGNNGSAVVIFDRDLSTGALTQKPGTAGCIQDDNYRSAENPAACTRGHGLAGALSTLVSPDGTNVYVASYSNSTVTIFDRQLPPDSDNDGVFDAADRCPNEAGPASNQGCPVVAPSTGPLTPAAPGAPTAPSVPLAPPTAGLLTAKMSIARATINRSQRVLDVLAPITARASGRVRVELHAAGRRYRFTAPIDSVNARIRFRQRIPQAQADLGTGIVTIAYAGDSDTRPQTVRLRAAFRQARLRLERPRIVDGRVRAAGTVNSLARGVVRLQLEYDRGGNTSILRFRAPIDDDGRWSLDEQLSETARLGIAQRQGTVHSYTLFTGYFQARIRGEMRSFQVLRGR